MVASLILVTKHVLMWEALTQWRSTNYVKLEFIYDGFLQEGK